MDWNKQILNENQNLIKLILNQLNTFHLIEVLNEFELTEILPFADKSLLVFRFSSSGCSACLEQEFDMIRFYLTKIRPQNILFIVTSPNEREMRAVLSANKMKDINLIFVKSNMFNTSFNYQTNDFLYFVLEEGLTARWIFNPQINTPSLTHGYFSKIIDQYFD